MRTQARHRTGLRPRCAPALRTLCVISPAAMHFAFICLSSRSPLVNHTERACDPVCMCHTVQRASLAIFMNVHLL